MIRRASPQRWWREGGQSPPGPTAPYCAEPLELVLRRERARSDRTGRVFSLLVFHLDSTEVQRSSEAQLTAILAERLRTIDYMGPLGTTRLGVVLPETSASGAQTLAEHVHREFAALGVTPRCEIYAYPTQSAVEGGDLDGNDHGGRSNGPSPRVGQNGEALGCRENGHVGNGHGRDGHVVEACWNGAGRAKEAAGTSCAPGQCDRGHSTVRPMELLFCRPLPRWKRCLDIAAGAAGLVLTAPIIFVAAAAIKCTSSGSVFFTQLRAGLGGKPFKLYKLRTMCVEAEAAKAEMRQHSEQDGPAFKMKHDPRVTRVGRLLRSTSLDELPQFVNVLRGDMSLVGPRPLPCDESAQCHSWQRRRLDVTPGITCIWQVSGRSSVSFDEWMRMDLAYIQSRTLLHDLKLILLTIPAVLTQRGAH